MILLVYFESKGKFLHIMILLFFASFLLHEKKQINKTLLHFTHTVQKP